MGKVSLYFGMRGEGKSTLVNSVCRSFGARAIYYDPQGEVPASVNYHSYTPRDGYSVEEVQRCLKIWLDAGIYRLIVVDELNRYCPSKPAQLPLQFKRLNDDCRHKNVDFIGIARRPCQVNQDITELADELDIFFLRGRNDLKYLDDISAGLSTKVVGLPPHHFVKYSGRDVTICAPVLIDSAWERREARHKQTAQGGRNGHI